ncbi:hypothetical protein [Bacillus chungangensis]|uniref:Uncharacterized protein n=1 Tax=Bacillus chungangensis TaxID=587633 RepID=A0ABT9WV08_9BACI|nr:hypothetical protein [Bacillus chungangensis]MDQ0177141.1 hypothetical protein [Bacillus chungangensis]
MLNEWISVLWTTTGRWIRQDHVFQIYYSLVGIHHQLMEQWL